MNEPRLRNEREPMRTRGFVAVRAIVLISRALVGIAFNESSTPVVKLAIHAARTQVIRAVRIRKAILSS